MSDVVLNHIYKVYPNGVKAVSDFNIHIKDKEFIVFVGPSGCGKSTTLRMIAGLEDITAGDLFIGGNLVNDVQPKDRDIAMVFQNYALYPHMTVFDNIAFSLKIKHVNKDEINRRVLEAAKILGIEEYLQRKPKEMSGGQRQRVALGRAIVRNPKVFLLDEPLSNLDAKLRAQMRSEITKLHKKLATTFIYVTHDQVEAMTMGTRIVVMKAGFVQQIDTPTNLYNYPINKFVAGFIGTPQMNFFNVTLNKDGQNVTIEFEDKQQMVLDFENFIKCNPHYLDGKTYLTLGIRPDNIVLAERKGKSTIEAVISNIEKLGNETLLYADLADKVNTEESVTNASIIIKVPASDTHQVNDLIHIKFNPDFIQLFDAETEFTVMPFNPSKSFASLKVEGGKMVLFNKTLPLPEAFSSLKDGTYEIEIPTSSIVDGDDFSLTCSKVQKVEDDLYLVCLEQDKDHYIFTTSPVEVKPGTKISFDVALEDVIFSDKETGIEPISHTFASDGKFVKVKEAKKDGRGKEVVFYGEVPNARYRLSDVATKRLFAIEGRNCFTNPYRLEYGVKIVEDSSNLIEHEKLGVYKYLKKSYLKVKVGDMINYIDITSYKGNVDDIKISFDHDAHLSAYNKANNVKII